MKHMPHMLHLEVRNEAIDGKKLIQVKDFLGRSFVCSRIRHEASRQHSKPGYGIPHRRPVVHRMFRGRRRSGYRLYRKGNSSGLGEAGHSDGLTPYSGDQIGNQRKKTWKHALPQYVRS